MKCKILSVILVMTLLLSILPAGILSASAYSYTDIPYAVEGGYIFFDKETGTITACDKSVTAANVPAEIDGVAVTGIGVRAFEYCGSLTSVTIPDSVTSIGSFAFDACESLTSVTIGNSVTSIGSGAFNGCCSLESVTIPDGVTSIESSTFRNCESLMSITIPDSVTSIGGSAFEGCDSLDSVTIPDSVTNIGSWAFSGCCSLGSVTIPDSVTSIGGSAFRDCDSLTGIWVDEANENYSSDENGVLFNKGKTALIQCPGGYSGSYAIPDSVMIIWDSAFAYCDSLTSVTIPDGVTILGDSAFAYCDSLTGIWVDEANEDYSSDENGVLFNKDKTDLIRCPGGYEGSYAIPDSVTSIGSSAFEDCDSLTSVTIPNSVTSIDEYAFAYCDSLTSVTIPSSVTSIDEYAFAYCDSLTGIWVDEANENYSSDESGVLFNKDKTTLIQCPGGYSGSYAIPDSVTSIGSSAFRDCDSLESVTIGNGVTSIGDRAFYDCDGLTSVTIPDSVTSIGRSAFENCRSLESVTIGNSVTSIGSYAFAYCNSLTSVTIGNGVTSIGSLAFYNCDSLERVTIPNSVTRIGEFAFRDCNSLTGIFFLGDAPILGAYVFYDMETDTYQPIPGLTLYYTQGAEGWTTPTWNGYPTALWNPDGFVDVSADAWYADAVEYAVENGLFNGMSETTFEPETAMTRAMLVTVLWRYAGEPAEGENTFTDVPAGQWYTDAVAWAAHNNIVGGVGDNKFDPNGNVTREQMATILYRYTSGQGIDTSARADLSAFPDAGSVSSYAKDPICWAVAEGLINGSDGKLLPQGNATRAQVATILMRFIENVVK